MSDVTCSIAAVKLIQSAHVTASASVRLLPSFLADSFVISFHIVISFSYFFCFFFPPLSLDSLVLSLLVTRLRVTLSHIL